MKEKMNSSIMGQSKSNRKAKQKQKKDNSTGNSSKINKNGKLLGAISPHQTRSKQPSLPQQTKEVTKTSEINSGQQTSLRKVVLNDKGSNNNSMKCKRIIEKRNNPKSGKSLEQEMDDIDKQFDSDVNTSFPLDGVLINVDQDEDKQFSPDYEDDPYVSPEVSDQEVEITETVVPVDEDRDTRDPVELALPSTSTGVKRKYLDEATPEDLMAIPALKKFMNHFLNERESKESKYR